jgi:hypothetical protein
MPSAMLEELVVSGGLSGRRKRLLGTRVPNLLYGSAQASAHSPFGEALPGKVAFDALAGERIRIETPGGGYGAR